MAPQGWHMFITQRAPEAVQVAPPPPPQQICVRAPHAIAPAF
jgi:hypothetical protein